MVKMSQREFSVAIGPVLHDLERDHPGLLHLGTDPLDDRSQAVLRNSSGWGTGVYLSDARFG